jgi:hypothetical protein
MRTIFFVPVVLVIVLASISLTARSTLAQRTADECLTRPGSGAPQGSHWYFRVNHSDHRHCWYLGPEGAKVHMFVRSAAPPTPPGLASPVPVPAERPTQAKAAEIDIGKTETPVDFLRRWLDLQASYGAVAPPSANTSYAEERMAADSEDDMPLIWPILSSADRAVASSPHLSAATSERIVALLAVALVLGAMIGRSLFKPAAAADRLGRAGLRDEQRSTSNADSGAPQAALSQPDTRLHFRPAGQSRAGSTPLSAVRRAAARRSRVVLLRGA